MSNTQQRIISAITMALIVIICVALGKIPTLILILAVGLLCLDELLVNFANLARSANQYRTSLILFFIFFSCSQYFI